MEDFKKAYHYCLKLLTIRSRSELELTEKLQDKGYEKEIIPEVINKLKEEKFIDDNSYAESLVQIAAEYGDHGYYYLRKKLLSRKLPTEIINKALENFDSDIEEKVAQRVYKKINKNVTGEGYALKQKLANRLKTRGFRGEVIAKIIFRS